VQILIISNPANAASATAPETVNITVGLADGTPAPGRIKLAVEGGGLNVVIHSNYAKNATIQGHPGAAGAAAVGAAAFYNTPACGVTTAVLENYSSQGGAPILFDATGTRLTTPIVRQKPNFVAPDGGNDTFLGFKDTGDKSAVAQCANNSSYPNFFGTSAAAPHAAAIAALMLQADSTLTPAQIYGALQSTALPMANTSPDANTGYGLIQADTAYLSLGLGTPPVTVVASQPGPKTGGGGGDIDGFVLLVLGGLGLARLLQQRRALGRAHDRRTGDFVVPTLPVVVDGNPDKTQAHYGER
jgi:subtilisin family serine protease